MPTNWETEGYGRTIVDCHLVPRIEWKKVGPFDGFYRDHGQDGRKVELKSSEKLFGGSKYIGLTEDQFDRLGAFDLIIASGCSASGCSAQQHQVSVIDSGLLRGIDYDERVTRYYYYKSIKEFYENGLVLCPPK